MAIGSCNTRGLFSLKLKGTGIVTFLFIFGFISSFWYFSSFLSSPLVFVLSIVEGAMEGAIRGASFSFSSPGRLLAVALL